MRVPADKPDLSCPRPVTDEVGAPLFGKGSINLHQLMIYISGPCLIVTIISCMILSWRHLHRYTSPQEQRQILRIVNLPIAYCLFNFLALTFTLDYMFIQPIAGVFEAFAVAGLFFLVLEYVTPDGTDREKYFDSLPNKTRRGKPIPGGSLGWFQKTWGSVLQYPLFKTILIIIEIITQYFGVYCENSFSFKHARLWLTLADYIFVGGATGAVIKFYLRVKPECAPIHRAGAKIWTFLGILFFQIIQDVSATDQDLRFIALTLCLSQLIFGLLNGKLFSPTKTATYNDINFGIASLMTCIESVVFSLIMQWSYSPSEYKAGQKLDRYGSGPAARTKTAKALLDACNPSDIIAGTVLALQMLFMRVRSRYGGSVGGVGGYGAPSHRRLGSEDQHLEPLSSRQNLRGQDPYMPPENDGDYETQYAPGYNAPPMPPSARDPSPGANYGHAQTWRADNLRPDAPRYPSGSSPPAEARQML